MPANPKYLNKSSWQQFAKIFSGIIVGYILTALVHMCMPLYLPYKKEILVTSVFTFFIVWCCFLIIPFLFKNGWKAFGVYMLITILLFVIYYLGNQNNPFI